MWLRSVNRFLFIRGANKKTPRAGGGGGEGVYPVRTSGVFKMRTSALFGIKTSKFMVCPHGQGEVKPLRTFFGQGGKVNFVRTSFMDGLLANAYNSIGLIKFKEKI